MILSQGFLLLFGPFMPPIQIPGGSISRSGQYSFSVLLDFHVHCIAALLVAALWWIYNRTTFGLQARATMQNPAMARALGVDTRRIYMMTFTLGAALAGLSGALLAPTTSIMPFMGQQFVAPAFITVVVGGATNVIAGAVGSSLLLSLVKTPVGFFLGAFLGTVALLLAALDHHQTAAGRDLRGHPAAPRPQTSECAERWPSIFSLLNGPEDLGRGPVFWAARRSWSRFSSSVPLYLSDFAAYNIAYYLLNIPMALGLCLLWGYCGVLSFGQVAYFGIAGYVYGIIAGNIVGHSWGPMLGSLGGLVICARSSRRSSATLYSTRVCRYWILPILTLVLTLLLETFLGQTAGYQWRVGVVQLGGYNGMTGIPAFQIGDFVVLRLFLFTTTRLSSSLICYLGLPDAGELADTARSCWPSARTPMRTELLGYDIRVRQLARVRARRGSRRASRGCSTCSGATISLRPRSACCSAALPVIWVAVGGREKLLAVVIDLRAQLAELPSVLRRQPIRPDHHRRAACHRHVVLSGRHDRHAGRAGEARVAPLVAFDSSSGVGRHDRAHSVAPKA